MARVNCKLLDRDPNNDSDSNIDRNPDNFALCKQGNSFICICVMF